MRSLVTGGSGFIGTHLCRLLLAHGHEVLNLDALTYAAVRDTPPDIQNHPAYHFLQADITDAPAVRSALETFRPDVLFHLAAETHVDRSIADPAPFLHTNIQGTYTLLQACTSYLENQKSKINNESFVALAKKDHQSSIKHQAPEASKQKQGVRGQESGTKHQEQGTKHKAQSTATQLLFLHISTDEVYGHLGPNDPPFTESSPFRPRSPYAASKAAAEHLVHAWHTTYGLPTIIVRPSNTYGPHQHAEKFIPTILHHARNGKPIPIYGSGENIRDWLHVEDHARAILAAATHGTIGHAYNISGGNEMTNLQLAHLIRDILAEEIEHQAPETSSIKNQHSTFINQEPGSADSSSSAQPPQLSNNQSPITFNLTPDRPGHDFRYALDTTKARQQLHWAPQIDLPTGLRQTIRHAP